MVPSLVLWSKKCIGLQRPSTGQLTTLFIVKLLIIQIKFSESFEGLLNSCIEAREAAQCFGSTPLYSQHNSSTRWENYTNAWKQWRT